MESSDTTNDQTVETKADAGATSVGAAITRAQANKEEQTASNGESQHSQDAEDLGQRSSRRKGVPRKVVVPDDEDTEVEEEPVRRARGRPRATAQPPSTTTTPESEGRIPTGSSRRRKARPPRRYHFDLDDNAEEARRRAEKEAIINFAEFDAGNEDVPVIPAPLPEEEEHPKGRRLGPKKKLKAAKEEVNTGPIVCQRCNMEFAALNQLKHHLMDKHTALWSPEHPEGETDAAAIRTIFKRLKKLNCRDCGKEFKSTTYYNFHIKWCGREDETVICPVCHKENNSFWMYQHMRSHDKKEQAAERAKDASQRPEEDLTGRRRSAAQKAMDNMHVLTEDLQDTESDLPRRRSAKMDDDVYIKLEDEAEDVKSEGGQDHGCSEAQNHQRDEVIPRSRRLLRQVCPQLCGHSITTDVQPSKRDAQRHTVGSGDG